MSHLLLFTAQGSKPLTKAAVNGTGVKRIYAKEIKSYTVQLNGSLTTTLSLPKQKRKSLGVTHRYITVQLYIPMGKNCSISLQLSDTNHARYRLILSTAIKASNVNKLKPGNPLHFQLPLSIQRNRWTRIVLDVAQLTQETFGEIGSGAMFRTVDAISVSANCRLRNIFSTLDDPSSDSSIVPLPLELVLHSKNKVINDVFVDGIDGGGSPKTITDSKTRQQPRRPIPSPIPTIPTPSSVSIPTPLPTPSKITLAFGTRVIEDSTMISPQGGGALTPLATPSPNVRRGNSSRQVTSGTSPTPPRSSSRRNKTPGSGSRGSSGSKGVRRRGNKNQKNNQDKNQLMQQHQNIRQQQAESEAEREKNLLPDDFYTYDMHAHGGGPLSLPSPAVPTYVDRAASPFDEETFTPSSRYGNVAEEEFQEFSEENMNENMDENMDENMEDNTENQTPVQFQDTYTEYNKYDNVVLEKEEEEMNQIPRCPTNESMSRMQVPPSFAMEANDGTVEDNADQRQEAAEDEEERLHLNESNQDYLVDENEYEYEKDVQNMAQEENNEENNVVDEEESDAEAHIAFLYSQLELKRRQIHRIEADLSGDEEDQLEELEELNNDGLDLYEEDSNDGVMLMDDNDMDALRGDEEEEGEEELVFDPILQCFYSPKTNQYYESK